MKKIKIGIIGIGNCASSLIQGIEFYKKKGTRDSIGLMHWDLGGYKPFDIEVVCAFDIDSRKVGKPLTEAILNYPNCTTTICSEFSEKGVIIKMGQILD